MEEAREERKEIVFFFKKDKEMMGLAKEDRGRKKEQVTGEKRPDQSPVRMTWQRGVSSQHRANGALN